MKDDIQKIDYTEEYRRLTREPVKVVSYPLPRKPDTESYYPMGVLKDSKINADNTKLSSSWQFF